MELTAQNVNEVAKHCLFRDDEIGEGEAAIPSNAIIVDGIVGRYGFHPDRLSERKADIASMLDDLPDEFKEGHGGGMSFLNACMTKNGTHWGEHPTMGMLFALGIGVDLAAYTFPREMWNALPGGVPYVTVKTLS
jgi:hypothetical protein